MVHYSANKGNERGLKISLTINDATGHNALMVGLVTAIRMGLQCDSKRDTDCENLIVVADFLEAIIPDEWQLNEGIAGRDAKFEKKIKGG